jgi:hypothetical protein
MKKRNPYLLLLLIPGILVNALSAQAPDSLRLRMAEANRDYQAGHFQKSIAAYQSLVQAGYHSPALYHNLGNAYFRAGQLARARLHYERALLLAPKDPIILRNRDQLLDQLEDRFEAGGRFFLWVWRDKTMLLLGAVGWGWLAFWFAVLAAILGLSLFRRPAWRQKWRGWTVFGMALLGFGLCLHLSLARSAWQHRSPRSILMAPEVVLRVAPDPESRELFALHAGTEVRRLDQIGNWTKVRLVNQRVGWLPTEVLLPVALPEKQGPSSELADEGPVEEKN